MTADAVKPAGTDLARAVDALEWHRADGEINELGVARLGPLLDPDQCGSLKALYPEDQHFRSTVDMARYRFGQGEYRYFNYPLPAMVDELRCALWPHLLPIARSFATRLDRPSPGPRTSISGSPGAMKGAKQSRPHCCCAMAPAIGTPCTGTSTASWCSRSRSSWGSIAPARTTRAASWWWLNNVLGPSLGPPPWASGSVRRCWSRPLTAPSPRPGVGQRHQFATGSAWCVAAAATPWGCFSTTPREPPGLQTGLGHLPQNAPPVQRR